MIDWNDANVKTLRIMWKQGASTREISKAITGSGDHRNSILGKARRIKLPPHANGTPDVKATADQNAYKAEMQKRLAKMRKENGEELSPEPKVRKLNLSNPNIKALKSDVWKPLPGITPVPLELQTGCKFIVTEDSPFLYCNAECTGTYCETHRAVVYNPPPESKPVTAYKFPFPKMRLK